ncbi:type IV secretory system conjugative DNA transfer family protein [Thermoanaerobacter sp. CM-CNRG TB177]|uniref:VirD4-like conjugal transfer protein, CD1115 family n=1 Tax=Thermoanaerobacter sp. CM-CNRG TB177 TaxID=2800659 RepID=UPI001BDDF7B2|nr:type IV secretory system conjugative DNA transfer family protein [Thermoanaerobacter sp. CM-CNRG TB177]MBT1280246.1 type IV secretory system conjugative DNA transfer family protein [Thermoanaerobacter sp. CM-CNRG TB177]
MDFKGFSFSNEGPQSTTAKILLGLITFLLYLFLTAWLFVPAIKTFQLLSQLNPQTNTKIDFTPIKQMYANPLLSLKELTNPTVLKAYLIFLLISIPAIAVLVILARATDYRAHGVKYLKDDGTHGTANWMTVQEAKKILGIGTNKGLILGRIGNKVVTLPPDSFLNRNVAIFGSPGSMKSRAYIRTNILQLAKEGQSMVITDPKGEIFRDMAEFLKNRGYTVKVFNLVNMKHSDRWNPIETIQDDIDAQLFVEVIISNTKVASTKSGDPFWDRAEQNLLKALALYVAMEYPEHERNIASVYSLLASAEPKAVDSVFKTLPNGHPAKMPYNIYAQANEQVRTGVIIGLGTRLQVFQNKLVQKITETSDIDLEFPGKEKCAYFCISSDTDSTFDFLAGLFFSFLFIKLTRYADMNGGTLNPNVYFLLDEFPNIGAIPDFTKKISTMRSRGIHSSVVFQNISQLKNRYPNDAWQEIIGNCDTRLFLGCTDVATAQFVSDLLGQATVEARSHRKHAGFEGLFDFGDISISTQKRPLLTPDEILRLEHRNAIVILRGQKPLMVEKMDYTKHPLSKEIKPVPITEYIPEWAEQEDKKAETRPAEKLTKEPIEAVKDNSTEEIKETKEEVFFISNTFNRTENGQLKIAELNEEENSDTNTENNTNNKEDSKNRKNKKRFW